MKKDVLIFLTHVLQSIEVIEASLKRITKKEFLRDLDKRDATVRRLEMIGEAVKNIPAEFRKKYPAIPWIDIAGTRDKLIHHYFGVDFEEVWNIVKDDFPTLKKQVEEILEKEKSEMC